MVKQVSVVSELQSIVGVKHAREPRDDRECAVDGLSPRAIVEPGTYEEVADVLRLANSERLALIPRGSGFHLHIGNVPNGYDIALSLARCNQIIEHEPADLTVTCQAGISVAALQEHLAASGQMVPLSRIPTDRRTIGGLLAANESELSETYGRPRDFTIGLRVVTGEGLIAKCGGHVVKNVAGYDLTKLFIGSLGTLGIIVEATFKLFPIPPATERIDLEFPSLEDAAEFVSPLTKRGLAVASAHSGRTMRPNGDRFVPSSGYLTKIRLSGDRLSVERSAGEIRSMARAMSVAEFDESRLPKSSKMMPAWTSREPPLWCRASVLPTQVPDMVHAFEQEAPGPFVTAGLEDGRLSGEWLGATNQQQLIERLRAATARLGGHLVVSGCSPELKREIDVFGPPPPSFPLMRAIKQQFDPNNVLSPGRFVGRL